VDVHKSTIICKSQNQQISAVVGARLLSNNNWFWIAELPMVQAAIDKNQNYAV